METRANFALIGAAVLASLIALAGFTLWMARSQFASDFDTYEILFEGPVALRAGADVQFNGLTVGEVERVQIDPNADSLVRARIRIDSTTPIRTDSVASIASAGLTGVTYVLIEPGTPGRPLVQRRLGDPIPVIQSKRAPLADIFAGGADIVQSANIALARATTILSDENIATFSSILSNIETISTNLASDNGAIQEAAETLRSLRRTSDEIADASAALERLAGSSDAAIAELLPDATATLADLRRAIAAAEQTIADGGATVRSAADALEGPALITIEEYRLMAQDFRILVGRLDGLARELEQNPQAIILGDPQPYERTR